MQTPNPSDLEKVLEKINEIAKESATGDYIYRGEPKHHDIVSSSLYREYRDIEAEHFDIAVVQEDILREAREYTPHKMEDFELLATLQHFGDKTNLIDFTTDYLVALFFACDGEPEEPGRVTLLQKQSEAYKVEKPPRTIRRAETQKSIFVQAPKGFVQPDRVVSIPVDLKAALLSYLRKHHDISTKTIYNDLQGFIENRGLHRNAYTEFYKGLTCQERADSAKTQVEKQKWYDAAITHYTETVGLNSEFAEAYNNRGAAHHKKGEVDAAIRDFDKAIDLNPEHATVYNNRGAAYNDKGEIDWAIQDFNTSIGLNPEDANAYYNRGTVYVNKGEVDASIQDYNKAIDLNSEYAAAYNNRGAAYVRKNDFDAAIQDFNILIDLNPEDADAYYNRGIAYARKGEVDRTIQDFNTSIDLNPKYAMAYYKRGLVWSCLKNWQRAEADLTAAKGMGIDIAALFHNDFERVEDFETKNEVILPENIAALLRVNGT